MPPALHDHTLAAPSGHTLHAVAAEAAHPVATLALLSGYGDHAGRYAHVLQWMADRGVSAWALSFRGHGHSSGMSGYVSRWEEYLDDLDAFLAAVRPAHQSPALPLFVLGHSHGGLVAAAAGIANRLPVRGVILSAPYLALKMPVSPQRRLFGNLASHLAPSLCLRSGIRGQMLTRDEAMAAETRADPLCRGIATPRWFTQTTRTQARVRESASRFTLPLLMLLPGDDTVADADASAAFFHASGSTDKQLIRFPDHRHELLRELGREAIFEQMHAWLGQRSCA